MSKVYIAAAFRSASQRIDESKAYGAVSDANYVSFLERIEDVFLDRGFDTCLPHRDEGDWGHTYYHPAEISALCLRHVETSDLVFAIAEGGRGVHIEVGYAAAFGKRLILAYKTGTEPSTLIWGLPLHESRWLSLNPSEARTTFIEYADESDLLGKLATLLGKASSLGGVNSRGHRSVTLILDVGSHTVKLKALSHRPGSVPRVVDQRKQSLGIIGDVLKDGSFSEETMQSVCDLAKRWFSECAPLNPGRTVVLGTAAIRKASNAGEFIARLEQVTASKFVVLSQAKELEYVFSGVSETFDPGYRLGVLNLGGGSTQVGLGVRGCLEQSVLLDIGTRHITERWPWNAPITTDIYHEMCEFVRARLRIAEMPRGPVNGLVHTGGELDFMLRCQVPLETSTGSPVHVSALPREAFDRFADEFRMLKPDVPAVDFGLDPAWASGAVASNVIAQCVAEWVAAPKVIPSNINIADGIVRMPNNETAEVP